MCWADSGAWLVTASRDGALRFWDTRLNIGASLGQPVTLPDQPLSMAGSAENSLIAIGLSNLLVLIFQFQDTN